MEVSKLSQKYQIVILQKVRQKMKLQVRSYLSIYPLDEKKAIILKHPQNYVKAIRGLGKEIWHKLGGGIRYIKQERASWHKKSALTR